MRILGPIVLTQALLMVAGKPEMPEGSAVRAQLVSCDLFRHEACLRSSLRMSLIAAHLSRRR